MEALAIKPILEAALMAADVPVPLERLVALFATVEDGAPGIDEVKAALEALQQDYAERGVELVAVAGGYRFQTRAIYADWVNRLWEERRPRYSRALLETLAIIAYRQPITRGEVEDIRGVAVSTGIIKTLQDREWIKVVGHRDVPGRPALYATTRQFLEYFNLASLETLPTLAELRDIDDMNPDLFAETGVEGDDPGGAEGGDVAAAGETDEGEGEAATGGVADEGTGSAPEGFGESGNPADDPSPLAS